MPSQGWSAAWRGTLEILRPGKHRFAVRTSGRLEVRIDQRIVLSSQEGKEEATGSELDLKFGLHPIEIRFQPAGQGAILKIFWESENFAREPLPAHVLGHMKTEPPLEDAFVTGRLAAEEHSCTACHRPGSQVPLAASLLKRPGPHLTAASARLKTAWIYHWLGDPQSLRPEAVMPRLFAPNRRGEIERYAVAMFLASQGKPSTERELTTAQIEPVQSEGLQLFEQTGCIVCHEKQGNRPARATLRLLGEKTTVDQLSRFIRNPASIDPSGRMPGFDLSDEQALKISTYLIHKDRGDTARLKLPEPPPTEELTHEVLLNLGRSLVQTKRCTACHELKVPGEEPWQARPAERDFADICSQPTGGCLSSPDVPHADVPAFGASLDLSAAVEFLRQVKAAPGTPAPGALARLTLKRLNCTGCHERDGEGGLAPEMIEKLFAGQTELNAEMVSPPSLTGIVDKLQPRYLREVLEEHVRSRPWMALKMPRFAKEQIAALPGGLAALEGQALERFPSALRPMRR